MNTPTKLHTIVRLDEARTADVIAVTGRTAEIAQVLDKLPLERQLSVCRMAKAMALNLLTSDMVAAWVSSANPQDGIVGWWSALPEADRIQIDAALSGMPAA